MANLEEGFLPGQMEEEPIMSTISPYTPMATSPGNAGTSRGTQQGVDGERVPRLNLDQHTNDSASTYDLAVESILDDSDARYGAA